MKEWMNYSDLLFLGESNHGLYFRARPPQRTGLQSDVAIKVLVNDSSDEQWLSVAREIQLLNLIDSDWVVQFHEAGHQKGRLFYAMEFAVMGTLARPSRALSRVERVRAISHAARGLGDLHELKVVHRDFKPAKVLVHENGGKLNDLGVASEHIGDEGDAIPTGSIGYMAPEVARGDHASPASDIFSVGAALYRVLSDKSLFPQVPIDSLQAAVKHIATTSPRLDAVDGCPNLMGVIGKCIATSPADRPGSARELASEIETAMAEDLSQELA